MRAITKEDLLKYGQALPRLVLPLITEDEFAEVLGNTPYIQRIREEVREESLVQGREEGREEGGLKKALETARKMLAKGYTIADIADLTGLTVKAISALA